MSHNLAQLYQAHFEELHRYAFTILNDSHLAEDAVQDCFIDFSVAMAKEKAILAPRAYLYKMVYNKALKLLQHKASDNDVLLLGQQKDDSQNRLEAIVHSEKEFTKQQLMESVLALMPEQCRTVFLKSKLEQQKYKEIAAALNISEKTVEAHMSKALKIIREFVRVNGISFTLIIAILSHEWN